MEYKKVKDLSPAQAAYLAGLIDGEGTVTLSRRNKNKHRGLVVTISNTEMILLKHVQTVTGVGKITNKRIAQPSHTPSYTYQVTNRQALGLLEQITPYLQSHKSARSRLAPPFPLPPNLCKAQLTQIHRLQMVSTPGFEFFVFGSATLRPSSFR